MEAIKVFMKKLDAQYQYRTSDERENIEKEIQSIADQQTAHLTEQNNKLREALGEANKFIEENRSIFDVPAFHLSDKIKQALNETA